MATAVFDLSDNDPFIHWAFEHLPYDLVMNLHAAYMQEKASQQHPEPRRILNEEDEKQLKRELDENGFSGLHN